MRLARRILISASAVGLVFALVPSGSASAATVFYAGSGVIDFANGGTTYAVGDSFEFTFAIDDGALADPGVTNGARYVQAMKDFQISFENGTSLAVDATDLSLNARSDRHRLQINPTAAIDPGFVTTIPVEVEDDVLLEDYRYSSFQLRLDDLDQLLFPQSPPELAPFPGIDTGDLSIFWDAIANTSVLFVTGEVQEVYIVPEPSTALLLAAGLAGLAVARR